MTPLANRLSLKARRRSGEQAHHWGTQSVTVFDWVPQIAESRELGSAYEVWFAEKTDGVSTFGW